MAVIIANVLEDLLSSRRWVALFRELHGIERSMRYNLLLLFNSVSFVTRIDFWLQQECDVSVWGFPTSTFQEF
jgi:hypothetical protein